MSTLATFFHGSDTEFGVFYPRHYLLAVYEGFREAEQARWHLIDSGIGAEEVIAVPGDEIVSLAEEHAKNDGIWGALMRELSRLIGTETPYADRDLEDERRGAGFIAVHCPDEHSKQRAWNRLAETKPLHA